MQTTQEELHRLAKRSARTLLSSAVAWQILSWIMTLATTRLLTPKDYGIMAMGESILPHLLLLATFGLDTWLSHKVSIDEKIEGEVLSIAGSLAGFTLLIGFVATPLVSSFFGESALIWTLSATILVIAFRCIQLIPESRLRRNLKFGEISRCTLITTTFRGLTQIGLALMGAGYWSLVAGLLLKEIITAAWFVRRAGLPKPLVPSRATLREAFRFGASQSLSSVFWIIFSTADNAIVGRLFGTQTLGLYAMAFYLADIPLSKVNGTLSPLLLVYFSRLRAAAGDLANAFLRITSSTALCIVPILIFASLAGEEIVTFILGSKWVPMITSFRVFCLLGAIRGLIGNSAVVFQALGRPGQNLVAAFSNCLIMVPSFYLSAMHFGLPGLYLVWLFIYPIIPLAQNRYLLKILGSSQGTMFRMFVPFLLPMLVAYLIVLSCDPLFSGHAFPILIIKAVMFFFTLFGLAKLFYPAVVGSWIQDFRELILNRGIAK